MKISIDIDGVLADFTARVIEAANKLWPGKLSQDFIPQDWYYTGVLNKKDWDAIWDVINGTHNFWVGSPAYEDNVYALKSYLYSSYIPKDVYFVTSRAITAGEPVQYQTYKWFVKHNIPIGWYNNYCPIVPVTNSKFKKQVMEGLGIEASIDDYLPTVKMCTELPKHKSFLLARPWNQERKEGEGYTIVNTLQEFLDQVK